MHLIMHFARQEFERLCLLHNTDGMDSKQTHTINIDAYMEWLGKARVNKQTLINPQFTVKDARQIFVTINLDDDLFQQLNRSALMSCVIFSLTVRSYTCTSWTDTDDRVTADDTADGLTKEEFFEAISRVCAEYYHSADEDAGSANNAEVGAMKVSPPLVHVQREYCCGLSVAGWT
eukprot:COSAG01_NODE_463_length_16671_cov_192.938209_13_plen_176_part_00